MDIPFLVYALLALLLITIWLIASPSRRPKLRTVAILVLGDIGRSPRMMYHAESFARAEFETYLIGYGGSAPTASLLSLPGIRIVHLSSPPFPIPLLPFILGAPFKLLHQIFAILDALLWEIPAPEFILVQNPPSIPTLALVWLVGRMRGSKIIIDWHNLGYSILALRLGKNHPLVKLARRFEQYFGRNAYAHLFVTNAMREYLVKEWDLQGRKVVLHDRPPAHFHRTSPGDIHELFQRIMPPTKTPELNTFLPKSLPPYETPFTHIIVPKSAGSGENSQSGGSRQATSYASSRMSTQALPMPSLRPDRPALLVSSTSWTPDEDFSILLEAIGQYDARAQIVNANTSEGHQKLPKLLVVVTGKGPLRKKYMDDVEKLQAEWKWVRCISMWLKAEDYPVFLGSADLGVSLHSSSSALDLPMKIVDMFGCGLPVCALDFACLPELVKDGINGMIFKDSKQLADQLETLLTDFPQSTTLSTLRNSLIADNRRAHRQTQHGDSTFGENTHIEPAWCSWAENWDTLIKPLCLTDADRFGL